MDDFFTYAELVEALDCHALFARKFAEMNSDAGERGVSASWDGSNAERQRDFVLGCLHSLASSDKEERLESLNILVYLAQGAGGHASTVSEQWECGADVIGILRQLNALPFILEALAAAVSEHRERSDADAAESSGTRMAAAVSSSYRSMRQLLSLLFLMLMHGRTDGPFLSSFLSCTCGGRPLLVFLLDLLPGELASPGPDGLVSPSSSPPTVYFPWRKAMLLIRWILILQLSEQTIAAGAAAVGHTPEAKRQGTGTGIGAGAEAGGHAVKSVPELFQETCLSASKRFFPTLYIPAHEEASGRSVPASYLAPAGLPTATREALDLLAAHSPIPHYPRHRPAATSHGHGHTDTTPAEDMYAQLLPRLDKYVAALLRLLLATPQTSESRQHSSLLLDLTHELVCPSHADSSDLLVSVELPRHKEIVLEAAALILLILLKAWRRNSPLQYAHLVHLLNDRNAALLFLKLLNQDAARIRRHNTPVQLLSALSSHAWVAHPHPIIHSIAQLAAAGLATAPAEPVGGLPTSLHMHGQTQAQPQAEGEAKASSRSRPIAIGVDGRLCGYLTLLRILAKLVKRSPAHARLLARLNASVILKRVLPSFPSAAPALAPSFRLYALKALKSLFKHHAPKWRATHSWLLNDILAHVPTRLGDDWLEEDTPTASLAARAAIQASKAQCAKFNAAYQPTHDGSLAEQTPARSPNPEEDKVPEVVLHKEYEAWLRQEQAREEAATKDIASVVLKLLAGSSALKSDYDFLRSLSLLP